MNSIEFNSDFRTWIEPIKQHILQAQIKASFAINKEMIGLYWFLGGKIVEEQAFRKWGDGFIETTSKELRASFPDISGFSTDNIRFMKRMYLFYNQNIPIVAQVVQQLGSSETELQNKSIINAAQVVQHFNSDEIPALIFSIPWGHHTTILRKIKNLNEAIFYIQKTVENNWSRSVLEYQIETNLYQRQGKAITNFKSVLPAIQSDLANALLKDPNNNPTIGVLLCKNKDNYEVEFALKDIYKPIGVSEYRYTELPENIRQSLPTIEELTN